MPPKLSSAQMFWWGVSLTVVGYAASALLGSRLGQYGSEVEAALFSRFGGFLSSLVSLILLLGIGLVVGSVIVRALGPRQ